MSSLIVNTQSERNYKYNCSYEGTGNGGRWGRGRGTCCQKTKFVTLGNE